MEVSSVSGGAASLQSVQKAPANNVSGGVEEATEKAAGSTVQAAKGNEESTEGSQQAAEAASKESGVGGNVNIKV